MWQKLTQVFPSREKARKFNISVPYSSLKITVPLRSFYNTIQHDSILHSPPHWMIDWTNIRFWFDKRYFLSRPHGRAMGWLTFNVLEKINHVMESWHCINIKLSTHSRVNEELLITQVLILNGINWIQYPWIWWHHFIDINIKLYITITHNHSIFVNMHMIACQHLIVSD